MLIPSITIETSSIGGLVVKLAVAIQFTGQYRLAPGSIPGRCILPPSPSREGVVIVVVVVINFFACGMEARQAPAKVATWRSGTERSGVEGPDWRSGGGAMLCWYIM